MFEEADTLPLTWRVEAYDDDGGTHVNIFSGGDAKDRAVDYAAWRYGYIYKGPKTPKRRNYDEPGDGDEYWGSEDREEYDEPQPRGFV